MSISFVTASGQDELRPLDRSRSAGRCVHIENCRVIRQFSNIDRVPVVVECPVDRQDLVAHCFHLSLDIHGFRGNLHGLAERISSAFCAHIGRVEQGTSYAQQAAVLEADLRYDPFENRAWTQMMIANGHSYAGRIEEYLEIYPELAAMSRMSHVAGL